MTPEKNKKITENISEKKYEEKVLEKPAYDYGNFWSEIKKKNNFFIKPVIIFMIFFITMCFIAFSTFDDKQKEIIKKIPSEIINSIKDLF